MPTIDIEYFFMQNYKNVKTELIEREEIFNPIKQVTEVFFDEIGR